MRIRNLSLGAALLAVTAGGLARAAVVDTNFVESDYVVASELSTATGMAWAPDGSNRLFVTRKDGEVRIIKNGQLLAAPFTKVTPIYTLSECGLIGIAFPPDFLASKHVYFFVTVSDSEQQIIRYTVAGDTGTDKTTIISGLPTRGLNHDGGGIGFGPDGKLYWSIGDLGGGVGTNADLTSLAAKVGRANRDGTAPLDNPFRDGSGPRDFIWARGMRNPFTMAFQPATGLLWLNVVGDSHEQIFIVRKGDHGGYSAQEANQQPPNIRPVIKYRTNGVDTITIRSVAMNGAVRSNGVITFTSTTEHFLAVGEKVTVENVADTSFSGSFFVTGVPDATSFTVSQPGPAATSGSLANPLATARTSLFGGCVTGGDFYDSSQAPARYRGDFFFADYNNIGPMPGRILRADLDPATNAVASVDLFATGVQNAVDVTVGPDGALYWIGTGTGKVLRAAHKAAGQALVVSPLNLWTAERQSMLVNISLAMAPAADVVVSVARASGDPDIGVSDGDTLTFTPANWNVPRTATIWAAADQDRTDDQASIAVSADDLATVTVNVRARDDLDVTDDGGVSPPADAAIAGDAAADATLADATVADAGLPDAGPVPDALPGDGPVADAAPTGEAGVADAAGPRPDAVADAGADVSRVAPPADAAGTSDAAVATDAATSKAGGGGCGCRLGGSSDGPGAAAIVLVLLGLLAGRRYRRPQLRLLK